MSLSTFLKPLGLGIFLCRGISRAGADAAPKALPARVEKQLRVLLADPVLRSGHLGVAIVALGRVSGPGQYPASAYDHSARPLLFGVDERKRFLPASNMKLFTAAWVLHRLGPEKKFTTSISMSALSGQDVSRGSKPGEITLIGGGDPSLTSTDLLALAHQLRPGVPRQLVVKGEGSLIGTESLGGRYPDGWTLDDTLWDYGAPVSGLAVNRNAVDIKVQGAVVAGQPAAILCTPPAPFEVTGSVITVDGSQAAAVHFDREAYAPDAGLAAPKGQCPLRISGTIPVGKSEVDGIAVTSPELWAAQILREAIAAEPDPEPRTGSSSTNSAVVAHDSPPLRILLAQFLKPSDNLYGEMLLRRAAVELPRDVGEDGEHNGPGGTYIASSGLAGRAHADMVRWLMGAGVSTEGLRFSDGSGLSRYNLVTPLAVAQLLGAAQDIPGSSAFYDALPIAGVDGTLKKRMKGTAADGNVHAKTGTFSIANCLSGYVTTRDGNRLAVSILTDFEPDGEAIRVWQGKVFALLAGSGG